MYATASPTILSLLIDLILAIIVKGKVLNYIPPYTFKLFYLPRYYSSFNYISALTILIAPYIVSFFSIVYISAVSKLLFFL